MFELVLVKPRDFVVTISMCLCGHFMSSTSSIHHSDVLCFSVYLFCVVDLNGFGVLLNTLQKWFSLPHVPHIFPNVKYCLGCCEALQYLALSYALSQQLVTAYVCFGHILVFSLISYSYLSFSLSFLTVLGFILLVHDSTCSLIFFTSGYNNCQSINYFCLYCLIIYDIYELFF